MFCLTEMRKKMSQNRFFSRTGFFLAGLASTIWFLIRVIPKPSRAGYPCMRAAAPIMSAFVIYLVSIGSAFFAFRKFKLYLKGARYYASALSLLAAIVFVLSSNMVNKPRLNASDLVTESYFTPNDPIGTARGIFPGRVVWVWDNDVTDETCTNTSGDYWSENTDAAETDSMLVHALLDLTGQSTPEAAWDALFRYFNSTHGKGDVGYTAGEKIYIKINLTNSCCSVSGTARYDDFERMDATPEMCLAILRQLVDVAGVAESDIYMGDPFRIFYDIYWNLCHSAYPDVNFCDKQGINGRIQTIATDTAVIKFSNGSFSFRIPQEYMDADYLINMSCLKTHNEGAITLSAKNHQGSILQDGAAVDQQSAMDLHPYLPKNSQGMGKYRHLVDYMGHNKLGGNTMLFIVDGIWAGRSWEGYVEKWQMQPFNNDYPSSLFLSQDEVAIQSVCYDFLLEEYKNKPSNQRYPYINGTDDFLYQAADPSYWPSGVQYDPEGDGILLGSLGVFEHWNDPVNKQYSRNLGTGSGIELIADTMGSSIIPPEVFDLARNTYYGFLKIYPNPASEQVFFEYTLESPGHVVASVYSMNGSKLLELKNSNDYTGSYQLTTRVDQLPAGEYLFRLAFNNEIEGNSVIKKFMVQ